MHQSGFTSDLLTISSLHKRIYHDILLLSLIHMLLHLLIAHGRRSFSIFITVITFFYLRDILFGVHQLQRLFKVKFPNLAGI